MGLFDFMKRDKKPKSSTGLNTGNYWIDNVDNLPLEGIANNRDEASLKSILKNDSNIHRRTFALAILWNIIDKDHDQFSEYFAKLAVELNLSMNEVEEIMDDYIDFQKAMKVIKEVLE